MTDIDEQRTRAPAGISAEAQAALQNMYELELADGAGPANTEEWEALVAFTDEMLQSLIPPAAPSTAVHPTSLGGVDAYLVEPADRCSDRSCLFLHGGGFTMGGGATCGAMTTAFAEGVQLRSIGVDYRMPPRHPYPAALDDSLAAYQALLDDHDPSELVVAGGSAGGNLAAALVLRARDEGIPLPAAVVLLSPEVDLTESGTASGPSRVLTPSFARRSNPQFVSTPGTKTSPIRTSHRCLQISALGFHPRSSNAARGTCSCPIRSDSTARSGALGCRPCCTCGMRCPTAGSVRCSREASDGSRRTERCTTSFGSISQRSLDVCRHPHFAGTARLLDHLPPTIAPW